MAENCMKASGLIAYIFKSVWSNNKFVRLFQTFGDCTDSLIIYFNSFIRLPVSGCITVVNEDQVVLCFCCSSKDVETILAVNFVQL